jgi:omega-amidase
MTDKFKLAVCQMEVADNKNENIQRAVEMIKKAAQNHASIAVLPEMFNCPYDNSKFAEYAESSRDGKTLKAISKIAVESGMYIVAGSIPELDEGKVYNSSFIFDPKGEIIGRHRKIHLFDIQIPGKISFKESSVLAPGDRITVAETEFCKIGVAVCYDMRFPELMRLMALKGAKLIVVPAAFNMVTGPAHWEPLVRIRAVDNQVYMAVASPAQSDKASYKAYGNSMIVEPWGSILSRADYGEEIIYADIDLKQVDKIRSELPLLEHRRTDVYEINEK